MKKDQPKTSGDFTLLHVVVYYVVVAYWSVLQLFAIFNGSAYILAAIAVAIPPGMWVIMDAKSRERPIPHILQPFVLLTWKLTVPIYLIATRRLRGVMFFTLHFIGTVLIGMICYYSAVVLFWGPKAVYGE